MTTNPTLKDSFFSLSFDAYSSFRDKGVTHSTLVKWGIGNDELRERYEWLLLTKK